MIKKEGFMAKESTKDLTNGEPAKLILGFMIPVLIGMLFQQFYSLADTAIVSHTLGVKALGAVGSTGSITFLTIGFCNGLTAGFAIPVAQRFGAGDHKALRRFVANAAWLAGICAVIFTFFCAFFCREILVFMRTPSDILDGAYSYLLPIFIGIPATVLYNLTSAIIRSLGDSKTPVYFLLLASVVNIALDLFFIVVLKSGIAGAAVATVISQLISGIACLIYMIKNFEILRMQKGDMRLRGREAGFLLANGIPMGLQYSITAIGSVILQTSVNTLGSDAVASVAASGRISSFFACVYDAIGSTMATYGGQHVGARKLKHMSQGLHAAVKIDSIYAVLVFIVTLFAGKYILMLVVDPGSIKILNDARTFLLINISAFFLLSLVNTLRFLIQGMGYSGFAVIAGICEMAARIIVAFFLVPNLGIIGAAFASPVAWLFADIFLIPAYIWCYKRVEMCLANDA